MNYQKNRQPKELVQLEPLTAKQAEIELLQILNRWARRYPAYLVHSAYGHSSS